MKRLFFPCLALSLTSLIMPAASVRAMDNLQQCTLDEAIQLFLANNAALQERRLEIDKAHGNLTTAGLRPNPSVSFVREELSLGTPAYSEDVLGIEYRVDPFGRRSLRIGAAEHAVSAAYSQFDHDSLSMIFKVKRTYLEAVTVSKRIALLEHTAEIFGNAARTGSNRFEEGDISGFDRMRLQAERNRYENELVYARIEFRNAGMDLGFLIGPEDAIVEYEPVEILTYRRMNTPLDELLNTAKQNRQDLKRITHAIASARETLNLTRREGYPSFDLFAGYKRQSDDIGGAVLGLTLSAPLFDRNQGEVATKQVELFQLERRKKYIEKQIETEVKTLHDRIRMLNSQLGFMSVDVLPDAGKILEIARFAYKEGDMSMLELLDAVRSHYESQSAYDLLLSAYLSSLFEIEKSIGTSLNGH